MDFTTAEAASQFIKLVSTVCPCTTTDRVSRVNRGQPQATLTSTPNSRSRPTTAVTKPAPDRPRKVAGTQIRQTGPSSIISAGSDDSHTLLSGSSDPLPEASFPVYNQPAPPATCDQTFASSFIPPPMPSQYDTSSQPAVSRLLPPSSQIFLSSTPIPSSSQMLPAPITSSQLPLRPGAQLPNTQADVFLESLMQSPILYDLSRSQLEAVVAQVIREEGFVKLVCVDSRRQYFSWQLTFCMDLA